jgi:hypothetical protein
MKENIKPKKCGENAWYIPNQKGFVPKIRSFYWVIDSDLCPRRLRHTGTFCDYALIYEKNCFETEQEAIDAFVKPVDPTPLTWDELCEIHNSKDKRIFFTQRRTGCRNPWVEWIFTEEVFENGEVFFNSERKYWRSRESLEAWIEKQKGE